MWILSGAFLVIAAACVHRLRSALRSRGDEIPCTSGGVSIVPLAIGLGGVCAMAGGSGVAIAFMDLHAGESAAFAAYLTSMGAAAVSFILAVAAWHTNRSAL